MNGREWDANIEQRNTCIKEINVIYKADTEVSLILKAVAIAIKEIQEKYLKLANFGSGISGVEQWNRKLLLVFINFLEFLFHQEQILLL